MDNRFIIKIKKPTQAEACMGILLLLPFASALFTQLLRIPSAVKYVCDVAYVFLLLLMVLNKNDRSRMLKREHSWVLLFLFFTFLVYLLRLQSPLYYLWGLRNNFRFYIAFFAFGFFMKRQNVEEILNKQGFQMTNLDISS